MKTMKLILVFAATLLFTQNIFAGRYYDASTGRFLTTDKLAHKFPAWSPYNYAANNPLKYIDPDGNRLVLNGTQEEIEQFVQTSNEALGGYHTVSVDNETGVVTVTATGQEGSMSSEQQGFFDALMTAADPNVGDVSIGLVSGSENVIVGSYNRQEIDMTDVQKFGDGPYTTSAGKIAHEISEQAAKQLSGENDRTSHHKIGIEYENAANGTNRIGGGFGKDFNRKTRTGSVQVLYSKDGKKAIVTYIIKNGNIIKVKQ